MRFSAILKEDANFMGQLRSDINIYMTRMKANGVFSIGTDMMVRELENLGYSLTPEALVDALSGNKYISKATSDTIELVGADISSTNNNSSQERDRNRVKSLATKAAKKGLKRGL